jgi:hypothetical protein
MIRTRDPLVPNEGRYGHLILLIPWVISLTRGH